jgi:hypothetical protein
MESMKSSLQITSSSLAPSDSYDADNDRTSLFGRKLDVMVIQTELQIMVFIGLTLLAVADIFVDIFAIAQIYLEGGQYADIFCITFLIMISLRTCVGIYYSEDNIGRFFELFQLGVVWEGYRSIQQKFATKTYVALGIIDSLFEAFPSSVLQLLWYLLSISVYNELEVNSYILGDINFLSSLSSTILVAWNCSKLCLLDCERNSDVWVFKTFQRISNICVMQLVVFAYHFFEIYFRILTICALFVGSFTQRRFLSEATPILLLMTFCYRIALIAVILWVQRRQLGVGHIHTPLSIGQYAVSLMSDAVWPDNKFMTIALYASSLLDCFVIGLDSVWLGYATFSFTIVGLVICFSFKTVIGAVRIYNIPSSSSYPVSRPVIFALVCHWVCLFCSMTVFVHRVYNSSVRAVAYAVSIVLLLLITLGPCALVYIYHRCITA